MTKEEIFKSEERRLEDVVALINRKLDDAKVRFKEQEHFIIGFKEGQRGTQFTRQSLMSFYATEIYNLETILSSPYFGRFDFLANGEKEAQVVYIGKRLIMDDAGKIVSYDWRSPICSMYYDFNIGEASYKQGTENCKGQILGKRQYNIKDSKLLAVDEQDTLSDDTVLMRYLSESADTRLRSIIATIQREQNLIIRSPLRQDYIVQGVAGSGKTTVALHRIAYLIYNEAKNIKDSEFMILGPNKYFLNYISSLLPDLDIKNVSQTTFEQIALETIKGKVKLVSQNAVLQNVLEGSVDPKVIEYKNSLEFLKLLQRFVYLYVVSHLSEDITYEGLTLCTKEKMAMILGLDADKTTNYGKKLDGFAKYLTKSIKEHAEDLSHDVWVKYRDEFKALPKYSPRRQEILDYTAKIEADLKKGCPNEVKNYFKFSKIGALDLYRAFIESLGTSFGTLPVDVKAFQDYTLGNLDKKQIASDDLAPLMYINYLLNGIDAYSKFEHLVIDEAQDLSIAEYYMLKLLFPKCNFDLFGDMNQAIYDYQSVKDWSLLNNVIFEGKADLLGLNRSYRTTMEIADAANLVLDYTSAVPAECIARSGEEIGVNKIEDEKSTIIDQINGLVNRGHQMIAIICKDDKETEEAYKKLKKSGINLNKISEKDDKYEGGLCIMPSYLSKGLEFDAVIMYDASNVNYTLSAIDLKLLYVAMTRAMHELVINYSGEIAEPLKGLLKDRDGEGSILKRNRV